MNVLVVSAPLVGHLFPLLPPANALRDAAPVVAATDLDVGVVLVRPPAAAALRPLPANVRTVGWVPLAGVLPHSTAFVRHGGAGGVLGVLAAGVPQPVTPGPGDRRFNAELVARRGVGLAVEARDITADVVATPVTGTALRGRTDEVRAEMAAVPGPAELVARPEGFVA